MANLTENTTYGSQSSQPSIANLSALTKKIQENAQKTATENVKGSLDSHFNPSDYTAIFGTGKAPVAPKAVAPNFPIGVPVTEAIKPPQPTTPYAPGYVAPTTFKQTEPLPEGYSQFAMPDANANWVSPSEKVTARNLPSSMGGGQYVVDPSQPGKMIKSTRVFMDNKLNPGLKQEVLGNLSPSLFQVDHIVPLWAGGADTLANLQVYDNVLHNKKTAIQAVPLTLLRDKQITLDQARAMALNWKTNIDNVPSIDEVDTNNGYLNSDTAKKYAQQWSDAINKPVGLFDKRTFKHFGESFNESMDQFGEGWLPDPIREFGKGLVGGGTAGIVPGTTASESSGKVGAFSNFVGNLAGMLTGVGLLGKGLGKLGLMGARAKAASVPLLAYDGIFGGAINAAKVSSLADAALSTAGIVTKKVGIDAGMETIGSVAFKKQAVEMLKGAGLLGTWGQIGQTGRNLTQQEEATLEGHMKQFFFDATFGGLTAGYGQSVKGYLGVGLSTTALALILGGKRENAIEEALKEGATMAALHLLGAKGHFKADGPTWGATGGLQGIANDQAFKMASARINSVVPELVPAVRMGETPMVRIQYDISQAEAFRQQFLKENPNDPSISRMPIQTQADATQLITRVAVNRYNKIIAEARAAGNDFTPEEIDAELLGFTTAGNQLYNRTLDPKARQQKEIKDLQTIVEQMKNKVSPYKSDLRSTSGDFKSILESVPLKKGEYTFIPEPLSGEFPTGKIPLTGNSSEISKKTSANIELLDNGVPGEKHSDQIFLVLDPANERTSRIINFAKLTNPQVGDAGGMIARPEDTVRAFYIAETPTGKVLREVGYAPTPERIGYRNNNFNENFDAMMNRIKSTQKGTETAEGWYEKIMKDPSQPSLTIDEARELYKLDFNKMADEFLLSKLKAGNPLTKYNTNFNNTTIAEQMRKNNLTVLPVEKSKLTKGSSGQYFIETDITPDNWGTAIALKNKTVGIPGEQRVVKEMGELEYKPTPPVEQKKVDIFKSAPAVREVVQTAPKVEMKELPKDLSPRLKSIAQERAVTPAVEAVIEAPIASKTPVEVSKAIKDIKSSPISETSEAPLPEESRYFDFMKNEEGYNHGMAKILQPKIEALPEGSPERIQLEDFRDNLNNSFFDRTAQKAYAAANNDMIAGRDNYLKHISNIFTERGLKDPLTNKDVKQVFIGKYRSSILNKPKMTFIVDSNGNWIKQIASSKVPESPFEKILDKKMGIKDVVYLESGIKEIAREDVEQFADEAAPARSKLDYDTIEKKFLENGYVPFVYDNSPDSVFGIKFNGKDIKNKAQRDQFVNSVMESMGYKKGISSINSFEKRLKSLNSHEKPSPIQGETHTIFVIRDSSKLNKTVKETTPNWDEIKMNQVVSNAEKVKSDLGEKLNHDGDTFASPELLKRRGQGAGYIKDPLWIKDTVTHLDEYGNLLHLKHETRAWTPEIKARFEKELGRTLTDTDYVTVEGNVKEGLTTSMALQNGTHWEIKVPSEAWSQKYQSPHELRASMSVSSILSKLPGNLPPETIAKIVAPYKKQAAIIQDMVKAFQNFDGSKTIDQIWKEYPALKKTKYVESLYKDLKQSADNGAGPIELGRNLNLAIDGVIRENFFKGRFFGGDTLHMVTDLGQKIDSKGTRVYLNSGEIMIPKQSFIATHGREAYKQLENGKEFEVLAYRFPVLTPNSVRKMKIIIAEDYGVNMGDSQVVVNSADKFGVFNADTDGDTLQYMSIEGKKGIPKELADAFVAEHQKGETYFPQLKSTPKVAFDGVDTYKKINEYTKNNFVGGKALGIAAASTRPVRELAANGWKMVFSEPHGGKRTYTEYLKGKAIKTGTILEYIRGKHQFANSPKGAFTIEPKFGDEEAFKLGFMGQAAADINGKSDLPELLKPYNNDPSAYATDILFTNAKDKAVRDIIYNETQKFQVPYRLDKTTSKILDNGKEVPVSVMENLDPYIARQKKIKAMGGQIGVAGEMALALDGVTRIENYMSDQYTPRDVRERYNEIQRERDTFASESVEKDFPLIFQTQMAGAASVTAVKFKNIFESIKNSAGSNGQKKTLIGEAWKKFKREEKLTPEQKEEIAVWAAISPNSNIASNYVMRATNIINDSPKVARSFFKGQAQKGPIEQSHLYGPEVSTPEAPKTEDKAGKGGPDGQGGLISEIGSGISNAWGNVKEKLLPGLTTSFKVKPDPTYGVRGLKVNDKDIDEAAAILYGEVSNRPDKQAFEARHIINTAINRAVSDPKRYSGSLTKVLQAPYQYQAYAPEGATSSDGKVKQSEYQKLKAGIINTTDNAKFQAIKKVLSEMKTGKFDDTTGGKTFYVHASDGSLWLGSTQEEAKKAANAHEKQIKSKITPWGTKKGLPVLSLKK